MALPNNPITRKEMYLSNMAGQGTALPSEPHTREEEYLDYIAKNGGGGGGTGDGDMKKSVYDGDLAVAGAGGIKSYVTGAISGKVDKVQGKGLSTNDYDDSAKAIVDGVTTALEGKVSKSNTAGLVKNDGTIDTTITGAVAANTSAISTIKDGANIDSFGDVETALAGKMPNYGIGIGLYVDSYTNQLRADAVTKAIKDSPKLITSGAVFSGLSPKYSTAEQEETDLDVQDKFPFYDYSASAKRHVTFGNIKAKLKEYFDSLYVAAVAGKGLSTNDYDDTEKAKVAGAFPRSEQAVLGAKQLLDISKAVYGPLTFSTSEQGRVVNFSYGTAAAWATVKCRFATKPNTNYRISAKATSVTGAVALKIQVPVSETNIKTSSFYTEPADFDFDFNSGNNSELELVLFGTNGTASVCNVTYEDLLITLGNDSDRNFAPYAMTNKELTEKVKELDSYLEQSVTLSTSDPTTVTFTNAIIKTTSLIEYACSKWGIVPDDITVSNGSCVITIPKQSTAETVSIRIYVR